MVPVEQTASAPARSSPGSRFATSCGLGAGVLIVVQPALSYAGSPPRMEWGAVPEAALTVLLVALVLVLGGVVRLVGRRHAGVAALGRGLLWSAFVGTITAFVVFNL